LPRSFSFACVLAAVTIAVLYSRHARRCEDPVLDLRLLRIRTFRIGTVNGGWARMGLDAAPFLLPLLFQVGFGLSPLRAGLLSFSSSLGAMLVRFFSSALLRLFGFRTLLVGNGVLIAGVTGALGLLRADSPTWLVVLIVLISGCLRSIQYLGLNTVSYADVPPPLLSRATSVGGVAQQLARGFGVALGAALLAVIAGPQRLVTADDFRLAFLLIALVPLSAAAGFLRLQRDDGEEVSGHHERPARAA
jgi:hypothetical protein